MPLFSLDELKKEPSAEAGGSGIHKDKFLDIHLQRVESIKQLTGRPPLPGEVYFLWTLKSFNAFTFIPYMIKEFGIIEELIISTYSISQRILNALSNYISRGKIIHTHILVSDSIKFRLPAVKEQLDYMVLQNPGQFSVCYSWNHSKVCLIKTQDDAYLVEGSGNFSENAQYEQYIFLNSPKVFEFRKKEIYAIQ